MIIDSIVRRWFIFHLDKFRNASRIRRREYPLGEFVFLSNSQEIHLPIEHRMRRETLIEIRCRDL